MNTLFEKNTLRLSNGRFASESQKQFDEGKKWKTLAMYLLSIQRGQAQRIRQLTQEINTLKQSK